MCRFLQPLHEFSSGKDRAVISAFLRSSDRHNVSYTLSKEGLFFRWAMTLYLILSGEALWLGGAWDAPTEGDGSCTSGN